MIAGNGIDRALLATLLARCPYTAAREGTAFVAGEGGLVLDVVYVALTLGCFALLALVLRGVERL
ncbi:hypothetical protein [Parafrankia sp. EUN1f]|uniref:hypothetical protein n=1 Tax=Parafrankia sp. EUN1f TaxID=102897 RepID=UPI0001C463A5|nr:hypothetical protein [Parafrankia sp. EUN1f]EFC81335.1 hypothetical protein FrEUN1fDRAFT_5532 [Parafrankia sp. EUN1f]